MSQPQHLECDTPDCIHWKDGECIKETSVTIQEHHCVDYEQHVELPTATVTIEVRGGVVQNVYASPDLPDISVELIDFDNLRDEPETVEAHSQRLVGHDQEASQTHFLKEGLMLNKMKSLIAQLKEADAAYYGKDNPIMTNLEYDRLYNELAQLERDTGIILASSPTQRVSGEVLEGLSAVSHTVSASDKM